MKYFRGNIWELPGHLIVIPTNCGWRRDGSNVMGYGLAKQAADRHPGLPKWYGKYCSTHDGGGVVRFPSAPLILFPVKPLNRDVPWASWRRKASIPLIRKSIQELLDLECHEPIAMPLVGTGGGGLDVEEVLPILQSALTSDQYTLVFPKPAMWTH